jgi:hypothetical protein
VSENDVFGRAHLSRSPAARDFALVLCGSYQRSRAPLSDVTSCQRCSQIARSELLSGNQVLRLMFAAS